MIIPEDFTTRYQIQSLVTGRLYPDHDWMLEEKGEKPSLLRSVYQKTRLELKGESQGLYTFADWLPVRRFLLGSAPPVTYRSRGLANALGLTNLYITFSGYFPETGALMRTCSFKETEAFTVCARLPEDIPHVLVVASAGNTARAFARVCSDNQIPLLLCVPEDNLDALWFDEPVRDHVKLAVTRSGSDYFDAIHLSNLACQIDGFIPEGGAKNIARRDGMGTTVLSAATTIGRIPEYYFQAVGSGTGAIAAWEANLRLIGDGRYGSHRMKLMLSQNAPFHPMYDAWKAGSRELLPFDEDQARKQVETILAKVLSNRRPPYSLTGGMFDALSDAGGNMYLINNDALTKASMLFEETEGIDIHPAAAVAVASLEQAVREQQLSADALIMLNITGGGEQRFKNENPLFYLEPTLVFDLHPTLEEVRSRISGLF